IAIVSIYGIVTEPEEIQQQVEDVAGSLDGDTQAFVTGILEDIVGGSADDETGAAADGNSAAATVSQIVGLVFGIGLALFSASGAVQKLIATISMAYEANETRPGWKLRLMAYGFTTAAIVGVVLMALIIGASPALLERANLGGAAEAAIGIAQFPLLAALFGGALTILYRYSPDRTNRTPWRNPGAIVGTLLFVFFAIAFSIYSANVGLMPASYGLLGSVAALMIFLQLTAIAVIVGAEVNAAVEIGALRSVAATAGARGASSSTAGLAGVPQLAGGGSAVGSYAGSVDQGDDEQSKVLSFGKALAGLIALFALARGVKD
ncbi:MAG: YihY/virulence factor BrkB family protein, partial [Acidimicrobiales bacterium]